MFLTRTLLTAAAVVIFSVNFATSQKYSSGIERVSLEAARSSNIWTASGYNVSAGRGTYILLYEKYEKTEQHLFLHKLLEICL